MWPNPQENLMENFIFCAVDKTINLKSLAKVLISETKQKT